MKFWNFQPSNNNQDIELRIDGDIIDDDDAWIYEWFGIKAASPNAFRNELAQYVGKNISVWINSDGGSVFAATGIYNALMEFKNTGAKVTTIIDSRAMSAAGVVFLAGDVRKITLGGIFMAHNPLTHASGYASDLRKVANILDVIKESIINAYQLATGKGRDEISAMMDDETYMSAKTAVKEGFATEILYMQPENLTENQESVMNFSFSRMVIQNAADSSMKRFFEVAKKFKSEEQVTNHDLNKLKNKEDNEVGINTLEELKKEKPELVNEITQEVIKNERERITALDALNNPLNKSIQEIVNDAKQSGKTANDIQMVVDIINKNTTDTPPATNTTVQHPFAQIITDSAQSGVNAIGAGTGDDVRTAESKEINAAADYMASIINKKNGVKK